MPLAQLSTFSSAHLVSPGLVIHPFLPLICKKAQVDFRVLINTYFSQQKHKKIKNKSEVKVHKKKGKSYRGNIIYHWRCYR